MKIKEAIDRVDSIKPNQYPIEDKVIWLSFLDRTIIEEVLKTHEDYDNKYDLFEGYTADNLTYDLIAEAPYDEIYVAFLKMKIDEENGETARYNNTSSMFNAYYTEFKKHYNKYHMPKGVGYKKM